MTGHYGPYVPPKVAPVEEEPVDLQVRPVPAGARRRDRKAWEQAEGERMAIAQEKGWAEPGTPDGLTRRGRKAWKETRHALHVERNRAVYKAGAGNRAIGVLVVLAVLLVLAGWSWLNGDDEPEQVAAIPVPVTAPPASSAPVVDQTAAAAAVAWYRIVCPSSLDAPQPARWATAKSLMTPDGFTSGAPTVAQPITWTCSDITATEQGGTSGRTVVFIDGVRKLDDGTRSNVHLTRVMQKVSGQWLVGAENGAG